MATTGHESEAINVSGLKSTLQKMKTDLLPSVPHYVTSASGTAGSTASGSYNRTQWTGNAAGISALATGAMVLLKIPVAGCKYGVSLNINGLGEHPVVLNVNTIISTLYAVGAILPLVYDADQKASIYVSNTNTEYTGCWKIANYDSNTTYTPLKLGFCTGQCDTAAGTAAKAVTMSSYALVAHGIVSIKFTNAITVASATLNINSAGAKAIYYKGAALAANVIGAGDIVTMQYNGTQYVIIGIVRASGIPKSDLASAVQTSLGKADTALQSHQDISGKADKSATVSTVSYTSKKITKTINGTTTDVVTASTIVTDGGGLKSHQTIKQDGITGATVNRFGTCSTAAGTAQKEVSITSGTFSLESGASVRVKFSNANTAGTPTLKVGSNAAKNIFHKGSQITTGGNKALLAGVCDFVYDGTQYHLVGNYIDTTYESKSAASGGTAVSLCTTGEKYTWNNKGTYSKPSGGIPKTDMTAEVQKYVGDKPATTGTTGSYPYNGLGVTVLAKNMVSNVNTLTAAMVSTANTIYVIKYDFVLGANITLPAGCVLQFEGGSISGAKTLTGANTAINAGLVKVFGTDVTLAGTWKTREAYPEWFGAKGDGVTDDSAAIQKSINWFEKIFLSSVYYCVSTLTINKLCSIEGKSNNGISDYLSGIVCGIKTGATVGIDITFASHTFATLCFKNFALYGNSNTTYGIKVYNINHVSFDTVCVMECTNGTGLAFKDVASSRFSTQYSNVYFCTFGMNLVGLELDNCNGVEVSACYFDGNNNNSWMSSYDHGYPANSKGVKISNGDSHKIHHNRIQGFENGVYGETNFAEIKDNRFECCYNAVNITGGSKNYVKDNMLSNYLLLEKNNVPLTGRYGSFGSIGGDYNIVGKNFISSCNPATVASANLNECQFDNEIILSISAYKEVALPISKYLKLFTGKVLKIEVSIENDSDVKNDGYAKRWTIAHSGKFIETYNWNVGAFNTVGENWADSVNSDFILYFTPADPSCRELKNVRIKYSVIPF